MGVSRAWERGTRVPGRLVVRLRHRGGLVRVAVAVVAGLVLVVGPVLRARAALGWLGVLRRGAVRRRRLRLSLLRRGARGVALPQRAGVVLRVVGSAGLVLAHPAILSYARKRVG